jgi:cyclopropane fatty-acyl-phospholipid synthase-like methyltransferase
LHRAAPAVAAKAAVRMAYTGWVERRLNIRTTSMRMLNSSGHFGDSLHYEACDYPFLNICLNAMQLVPEDVVYEIGCGMGRALCLIAQRQVKKCIGVELSEVLADRARANLQSLRRRKAESEVIVADAAFADYSEGTSFYLFNPFGAATMVAVLERIRSTLDQSPRPIRVMYVNPCQHQVLADCGWLRQTEIIRSKWFRTQASLWVHDPAA